jgi:hypothetical protein
MNQNRYPALRLRYGAARDVAAPWSSSSDARPLKHGFVPHRWEPDNAHDSIFLISDIRRAPARLLDVYPSIDQRARNTASPATGLPPFTADSRAKPLSPQFPSPPADSLPHQKPIAADFQTASFKSLYRKRSGNQDSPLPSSLICRSVSDTALALAVHWGSAGEHQGVRQADSGSGPDPGAGFGRIDWVDSFRIRRHPGAIPDSDPRGREGDGGKPEAIMKLHENYCCGSRIRGNHPRRCVFGIWPRGVCL